MSDHYPSGAAQRAMEIRDRLGGIDTRVNELVLSPEQRARYDAARLALWDALEACGAIGNGVEGERTR